jgi:N-acetylglutamate synthase/N-acetylornithine aminotransferase
MNSKLMSPRNHDPDPTKNVLDLVNASIKRLDDIQILQFKRVEERIADEIKRMENLFDSHIIHAKEINAAEKGRIDAIRVMDATAIAVASEQAHEMAKTLADQLSVKTEALRDYIATVQTNVISQRTIIIDHLSERIGILEANQFKGQGRSEVSKSILAAIAVIVGSLITILAQHFISK